MKSLNPLAVINEMREAGLSRGEIIGELIAAISIIAIPVSLLLIGHVIGL